tara:strand:+ start:3013 stop:4155 length:1143 start_codon:yes stop_codon:yes gene_type:complete
MEKNIRFFLPGITKEDKKAVLNALNNSLLTDGPKLRQFESAFAKFTGAKYTIGVSNATSALHLSIKAHGIKKGDEVIVPDMTFVATANAVVQAGATPIFADVEKETMNISVNSIKKKITSKTKAIIPVHFAGKICDIVKIIKFAKKNNLIVIEDCAHAIGTQYNKKHVGNFGNAGCFSFYPTKNITTIEGGMVITNSKKIAQYVMSARNHGLTKTLEQRYANGKPWDYDMIESGFNYRLDEVRSALGLSQLKRIKKINTERKRIFEYYNIKLKNIEGIVTPNSLSKNEHAYHLYIMRIKDGSKISRDQLFTQLLKYGIKTTVHYKPLHKFTAFKKLRGNNRDMENSNQLYKEIISLPLYLNMPKKEQDYVIDCIIRIMNN